MRHGSALVGTAMLLLTLLSGCGSDSTTARDDTPTTATTPAQTTESDTASPTGSDTESPTGSDTPTAGTGSPAFVDQADVEDQITQKLTDAGEPPTSTHCDGDLRGVVGTRLACSIVLDERTVGVTVEVTSVDGDTVNFTISLDDPTTSAGVSPTRSPG